MKHMSSLKRKNISSIIVLSIAKRNFLYETQEWHLSVVIKTNVRSVVRDYAGLIMRW